MSEQAKASAEITTATQNMRLQADQVTKAMREQARTAHEMTIGVANVSKEALRITNANRNHLESADRIRGGGQRTAPDNESQCGWCESNVDQYLRAGRPRRQLGEIMDSMMPGNGNRNRLLNLNAVDEQISRRKQPFGVTR